MVCLYYLHATEKRTLDIMQEHFCVLVLTTFVSESCF